MKQTFLRLIVSFAFLGILVYLMRGDMPQILDTLKKVNPWFVGGGVAAYFIAAVVLAKRLTLIFAVQDVRLSYPQAVHLTFIGYFFNNFLPTAVGGDLVKAYCSYRISNEKFKSFISILMDRVFGLMMFVLIPSVTVLFLMGKLDPIIPTIVYGILLLAVIFTVFFFNKGLAKKFSFVVNLLNKIKLGDKLRLLYEGIHGFRSHKGMIAKVSVLSLLAQFLSIGAIYFFIRALDSDISIFYLLLLTPIVHLMSMVPSINGLGVRESAFVYFFKGSIGVPAASALAILYLFLLLILSVIGVLIYMTHHEYHFKMKEVQNAEEAVEHHT
jgi:glycosyltransferase 2 family protein